MHNLMGHMHLHSDSKPFKCLYCPSKFTLKGNLTRHMKVKHGVMDRGLDERLFRQRGRFCLSTPMGLLTHFSQEEPFDLSQKPPGLRLSQSDGESVPGSSCQEEDEESLYRRSQYSPEVDQHEPTGEDQYLPELEERGEGEKQKQMYQRSLDDQTYERESAEEGHSLDHTGDQVHLLQSEDTPETAYESDLELGDRHETSRRQSYDSYDSDSELEDQIHHHEPEEEPEESMQQLDGFCEPDIDVAGRKQSRFETSEFMEATGPQDEGEE